MSSQAQVGGPTGTGPAGPVRCGLVPPAAGGSSSRPETGSGLAEALGPGGVAVLMPGRPPGAGAAGWAGTCGKTQLAVSFAESLWQDGSAGLLLWVTATSRAAILSGFAQAARSVLAGVPASDAETLAARFVSWLGETSQPWLLILDDLAGAGELEGLWPAGSAGRTVITTASTALLPPGRQVTRLAVGPFSPRESLSYLMSRLTADPDQRLGAIDLVDELAGEPLALAQAAAVIASSALSCRDYREHFLRRRDELAQAAGRAPAAAEVSWTLSVEHADRLSRGGPGRSLLALAAMLDGNGMPAALFTTRAARDCFAALSGAAAEPAATRAVLLNLERAGLLTIDPAGGTPLVRMDRPVQAAIRTELPAGMLERVAVAAADALLEAWPREEPPPGYTDSLRACVDSLQQAAGEVLWAAGCHPVLLRTAQSLDADGLTGPALACWQDVTASCDRVLGGAHQDTLLAADRLASACLAAGRSGDAVSWYQWVLAGRTRAPGADQAAIAAARVRLGRALAAAGKPDEAVSMLTEAVADCERVLGADGSGTIDARDELAAAQRLADRLADAVRLYRHTLTDRERIQGQHHPATMATRQALAETYLAAGQIKDAMSHFKRVLADRERVLGPDHPDTITARGNLAAASHAAGRMASAVRLYEQARDDSERVLGADHADSLACNASLAHGYYAVGRLTDAKAVLLDSLARCERVLPPGDPLTQAIRVSLGNITGN